MFLFWHEMFLLRKRLPGTKFKAMLWENTVLLLGIKQRAIERSLLWNISVLDPLISQTITLSQRKEKES